MKYLADFPPINLVEMKGFQNVSITEIAEKAMVNRNTIYINYGSKEEILESIIKNSITSGYSVVSVTKPVYDVKENVNDNDN